MTRHRFAATALTLAALGACAPAPAGEIPPGALPRTRPERTNHAETSTYQDVVQFVDSLRALGAPIHVGSIGTTTQGRAIPFVIASRPLVTTPEEARRSGRPIAWVQGNIHAGEVEGKEALQALLRDLVPERRPNALDSLVLIAVPIYNADGNEAWGPQARNRSEQNGPERVGERPNAQGLDLNRDYMKAEAPETRASLQMFNRWDPDLFVDLHTTDGSYHGYALTYSPSLNSAAGEAGVFTRDRILPELRRRVRERRGFETFDYGNFALQYGEDYDPAFTPRGWYSYDHRPRFGTNYYGLRDRVSVLSEAFSHDPLDRRVASTYAFVRELLSLVAEQGSEIRAAERAADSAAVAGPRAVAIRSQLPETAPLEWLVAEDLEATGDTTTRSAPGVRRGLRRPGQSRALRTPSFIRFEATLQRDAPAGWVLQPADTAAVRLLRLHGIAVSRLTQPWTGDVAAFAIDSVATSRRAFQGHQAVTLLGDRWTTRRATVPAGAFLVSASQPLSRLATVLLAPRTDDGLVTWNVFDAELRAGGEFPVWQLTGALPDALQPLP